VAGVAAAKLMERLPIFSVERARKGAAA
jgi:hypothetical protein